MPARTCEVAPSGNISRPGMPHTLADSLRPWPARVDHPVHGNTMLRLRLLTLIATAVLAGPLAAQGPNQARPAAGLDLAGMERTVQPGDSFWQYANGTWLRKTEIPADRTSWGPGEVLSEVTDRRTAGL